MLLDFAFLMKNLQRLFVKNWDVTLISDKTKANTKIW